MNRSDLERARTLSPIPDLTLEGLARRRERKDARRRKSTLVVIVVIASLAVGAVFAAHEETGSPAPSPATEPSVGNPVDPAAEEVARSFLHAFGSFHVKRAMTYVADDADLTGMEGFPEAGSESLSMLTSFLKAFGQETDDHLVCGA